jgi:hypothetical protein
LTRWHKRNNRPPHESELPPRRPNTRRVPSSRASGDVITDAGVRDTGVQRAVGGYNHKTQIKFGISVIEVRHRSYALSSSAHLTVASARTWRCRLSHWLLWSTGLRELVQLVQAAAAAP